MAKTNRCVVRNEAYRRNSIGIRERHNERKNKGYSNPDIVKGRSYLNVHFKTCGAGYEREFNRLVEDGTISLRGLQADAKVFDELIFDVNTAYFEDNGGYEYAKDFFAESYKLAVKEAGGEEYILSAVMHADERNRALSDKLGRDVFHYHLHVVYVPVVNKEIKWTKRCKDPALVGTVKEVVKQVSHSKKWPKVKRLDEQGNPVLSKNGKAVLINSYSLLQDRFFEHMSDAGFTDFERGERGSTTEHLSVLDYKIQQDEARAVLLDEAITEKVQAAATLDKRTEQKQGKLAKLDKKLSVSKQVAVTVSEIEGMAKKTLGGNIQLSAADWQTVSGLAKEGLKSRDIIQRMKEKIDILTREIATLKSRLLQYGEGQKVSDTLQYYQAKQRAPHRLAQVIADIMHQPPEQQAPENIIKKRKSQTKAR